MKYMSKIGIGTAKLGNLIYGDFLGGKGRRILLDAYNCGVTYFDTSNIYRNGWSEKIIGSAFANNRDKVVISTKVGKRKTLVSRVIRKITKKSEIEIELSKAMINSSVSSSLKSLQTNYIDILYLHSPNIVTLDKNVVKESFNSLKKQGMVNFFGASCDTVKEVEYLSSCNLGMTYFQISAANYFDNQQKYIDIAKRFDVYYVINRLLDCEKSPNVIIGPLLEDKIHLVLSEACIVSSLVGVRKQDHLMELCSIISKESISYDI